MKGQEYHDKYLTQEISEVRAMCRVNFNGKLELAFLPYSGGFYDQPAPDLERILLIIRYLNEAIEKKQKEERKK
ncbi:hypothetical protein BBF96_03530 [Anoxybacter fermentans]|uniref:Uncharacterized protein n=2 Tax=Anoxybacter fermentans TaxID=1323375 RepID=A0A3S9SW74_9FIRM|nr:hypothetical protein BBF96_03530 [Anoxybacter fermentans]